MIQYGPVRLQGVETADPSSDANNIQSVSKLRQDPTLAQVLQEELEGDDLDTAMDSTVLKVDKNHAYSVWLSYAEVYNEKIYDLLADTSSLKTGTKAGPSTLLLARKALALKPSPPSDWEGSQNTSKYVAGLRQIRVHSAAQAKEILKLGQLHRRVFGTLANSQSSRSHALVTVKVLRCHRGEYHVRHCVHRASISRLILIISGPIEHTDLKAYVGGSCGFRTYEKYAYIWRTTQRSGFNQQVAHGSRPMHGGHASQPETDGPKPGKRWAC